MDITTTTRRIPSFPGRSRLAVWRDITVIAVSLALIVGFLAQVWRAPVPAELRTLTSLSADARA